MKYWLEPVKDWKETFLTRWNNDYYSMGEKLLELGGLIWICICQFFIFPLFIIGQIFSRFFPLIAFIYYEFDIENVQLLQWILTIAYTVLLIAWFIAFIRCINYYKWTNAVLPSSGRYWSDCYNEVYCCKNLNLIQKYYNIRCDMKYIDKKRRQVVIEILGKDIGNLIVSYWSHFEMKHLLYAIDQEFHPAKTWML